jgi:hypothetical protein
MLVLVIVKSSGFGFSDAAPVKFKERQEHNPPQGSSAREGIESRARN